MATKTEKAPARPRRAAARSTAKKKKDDKIPFHRQPEDLSLERWQVGLRRQFGADSAFTMENLGSHPVFSDFTVRNPETKNGYRVAIRSRGDSANFCACMDFKTNRLGTCKHIAFALSRLEKKRGNKGIFKRGFRQPHSSIFLDYREGRQLRISVGTEQEEAFRAFSKKHFDESGVIRQEALARFEKVLEEARRISPDFRCYDDALEFVLARRDHLRRNARLDELFPQGKDSPAFDDLVKIKLFEFQRAGVLFAARAGRSLIADEMGLGKTVQAIAAAELFRKEFGIGRVLVVCPTSLKYQWKSEIERFTDSTAHVVEGGIPSRKKQYKEVSDFFTIAGYHTVANDLRDLNALEFDLVILDEAQRIKNWQTKTSAAIKRLRSTYAIVLTGTPLENKLEELYSIMQVIDQFRLPPLYRFLDRHLVKNDTGKVVGFRHLKEIAAGLSDVLLRRTKKQVLKQIPKRMDKVLLVPMTAGQRDMHDGLGGEVAKLIAKWIRQKFLHENDRKRLILFLSQMRMACDSTFILDQTSRHDTKVLELMCILEEFFSGDDGEKVVVFSQWQRMGTLVAQELEERGIGFQFLHGSVPSKERGALLKTFKDDPDCRVFLSTDAGGVGLNLQNASLVVSLDVPWNPAVLEQRIARVWRMGQERPVQVVNLVSAGTIEHKMLDMLKFKDSMAKGVLDDGEDVIFMETSRFNEFMGKVEDMTGGGSWTSDIPSTRDGNTIEEENADLGTEARGEEREVGAAPAAMPSDGEAPTAMPEKPRKGEAPQRGTSPIPGDDDVPEPAAPSPIPAPFVIPDGNLIPRPSGSMAPASPQELVQTGVSFLSGLAKTLSDPVETQKLVGSITARDEQTGQTYLKIPVENEQAVAQALAVLGGLFRAFGGGG